MANVNGDDNRKGGSLSERSRYGIRKSCDSCGRKKKRCDGEEPCSRCVRTDSQCRYSKRRWHDPNQLQHRQQHHMQQDDGRPVDDRGCLVHSRQGRLLGGGMLPLKRCRLRASPATGLVGMQENAFLSDFFGCVGFLPLTNERQIRETMVKIMMTAYPQQEPGLHTDNCGEEGKLGTCEFGSTLEKVSGANPLPKGPSVCTFWCAIAVGALAKGSPIESVERYYELAKEAWTVGRSGSTDVELATASVNLTYLHDFMGDAAQFRESLDLSESFLIASMEQGLDGVNTGLPDLIQQCRKHCRKADSIQNASADSAWTDERASLQWTEVATEDDVYRYVAQSFRGFDQAVLAKVQEQLAGDVRGFSSGDRDEPNSLPCDPLAGAMAGAIAAVFGTTSSFELETLEDVADRPTIRAGLGGLLVNGALVFEKAAKGDLCATLERLDRVVEVYEQYPGLCRCMMGCHLSHMVLAILAEIGDGRARGMYNRLREVEISCGASHSSASHSTPIPSLDDWQGLGAICGDLRCRAIEILIKSKHVARLATASFDSNCDNTGPTQTFDDVDGQARGELSSISFAQGNIIGISSGHPSSSWTELDATSRCSQGKSYAGAPRCDDAAVGPQASPLSSSSWSKIGFDSDWSTAAVSASHPDMLSSGITRHRQAPAEVEEEEIAAADWLEATLAMADAVHAS